MKNINNNWVDKNNNSWNAENTTKEQAEAYSKTLIDCSDCHSCRSCRDCHSCSFSSDCRSCHNFTLNPQRYTTTNIGSRESQTTFYWDAEKVLVICGCFKNDMEHFEQKVKETYPAKHKHRLEYMKEIKKVKYLMK